MVNQADNIHKELTVEESAYSFPKSLRRIKSRWRVREDKKDLESTLKENNLSSQSLDYKSEVEDDSRPTTTTNNGNNCTIIDLEVDSALDSLIQAPVAPPPSPEKEKGKRRKAFHTIKSYLEKNRTEQNVDNQKDSLLTTSPQKGNLNNQLENMSSNQLSLFHDDADDDINEFGDRSPIDSNQASSYLIDTLDTKVNEPKNLFDILKLMDKKPHYNTPELSSDINNSESNLNSSPIDTMNLIKNTHLDHHNNKSISTKNTNDSPIVIISNANTGVTTEQLTQGKLSSLFVGDLNSTVNEQDLYLFFANFTGLISVKIPLDTTKNQSLSYGYVNFDNQQHADIATEALNYRELNGTEIRIMPSVRDKVQRENMGANLFFSNLDTDLSTRIMYDRLKVFGKIFSCKYSKEKGTCFVNFADKLQAYKICKQFNDTTMDERIIYVSVHISKKDREIFNQFHKKSTVDSVSSNKISKPSSKHSSGKNTRVVSRNGNQDITPETPISTQYSIFIRNMPLNMRKDVIKNLVEPYGTVKNILTRDVPTKKGSWALVTMTNKEAVDRTIHNLNSVELDGKQLFVTRAIPREEKEYAKKEERFPKKKLKLLVNQINLETHRELLEHWCSKYDSIKSAEFYSSSNYPSSSDGYGYIEIDNEAEADQLVNELKTLNVSSYKILIVIPSKESNVETVRYPYIMNSAKVESDASKKSSGIVTFSYINPNKMYQLANFQHSVDNDRYKIHEKLENHNKTRFKERWVVKTEAEEALLRERRNEVHRAIWELCAKLFVSKPNKWVNQQYCVDVSQITEMLSKSKVCSLTEHLIKFFWANNFNEFYKFLKNNQFDEKGSFINVAHPVLSNQLIQSAAYLGIIPK